MKYSKTLRILQTIDKICVSFWNLIFGISLFTFMLAAMLLAAYISSWILGINICIF